MKKIAFVLVTILMTIPPSQASNTLKLLGEKPDAKLLIIHADDIGMSHNVNVAGVEALKKGIVTSASVMMPCPWVPELVNMAKKNPGLDLGVHLTMNSEWGGFRWQPVAPNPLVKGLIDPDGYMHAGVMATATKAKPEEVEAEIRAQVQKAIDMGLEPTHIDSHMGTIYARGDFFNAAVKVSEEFDIPFMMMDMNQRIQERWGARDYMYPGALDALKGRGLPLLDDLLSIDGTSPEQSREWYKKTLARLQPGVSLLIIHPGLPSEELSAITSHHRQREMDYEIFTDPKMRAFIEKQGIKLIGWKELKAVWDRRTRLEP